MSSKRVSVKAADQIAVLRLSRRRCCICYGLNRDDTQKKGQIAHLDRDSSNSKLDNLAWLCFDHHDEYDSSPSQSKSLQMNEVKSYREELYDLFAHWNSQRTSNQILRFLADTIDEEAILSGAIKVGSRYRDLPELLVEEVLSWSDFESEDMDIWVPHSALLEDMQSWGFLRYELEQISDFKVHIRVWHEPVCAELLSTLKSKEPSDRA